MLQTACQNKLCEKLKAFEKGDDDSSLTNNQIS